MLQGTVKFFNDSKGFGFITEDEFLNFFNENKSLSAMIGFFLCNL